MIVFSRFNRIFRAAIAESETPEAEPCANKTCTVHREGERCSLKIQLFEAENPEQKELFKASQSSRAFCKIRYVRLVDW